MIPVIVGLLTLVPLALIALFLAFAEYLDWHGRMEVLEKKHPQIWRLINDRAFRLVMLFIVFSMLAVDLKENLNHLDVEAPPMKFTAPVPPAICKGVPEFVESKNSLRRRTIQLVSDLNAFWSQRPAPTQQPIQNPTTDEDRQRNAKWDKYWRDIKIAYTNADYQERILGIVREYKNKGIDIGYMERSFEQPDRLVGAGAFGGWQLDNCGQYMNELCQLRELAYHVNAHDEPIFLSP